MTTDVQSLLLKIDASTELARRELKKMDGDFDSFTRRSEEAAGGAEQAFAKFGSAATLAKATIIGFATGIGVEGVISFGRAVLTAADNLDAAAEKAGVSVERYQTLKESLRSLEVEGDKVDGIFGRLTDTLGAVQGGTAGEAVVKVLDRMGITSRILNGEITTTDGLLDAIAESAGRFGSQAEFTAGVIDLVGKKFGIDLANAIKDGGAALKAGEQSFRDAGAVVSEEYIKTLADANEAVDRFASQSSNRFIIWGAAIITQLRGTMRILKQEGLLAMFSGQNMDAGYVNAAASDDGRLKQLQDKVRVAQLLVNNAETVKARGGLFADFNGGSQPGIAQKRANLRDAEARLASFQATLPKAPAAASPFSGVVEDPMITVTGKRNQKGAAKAVKAAKREPTPAELRGSGFSDASGREALAAELMPALVNLDAIGTRLDDIKLQAVDLAGIEILDLDALRVGVGLLEDASFSITNALTGAESLGDALVGSFARAGLAAVQSGILNLLSGGKQGTSFGDTFKGLGSLFSGKGFAGGGRPPVGKFSMVGERGPELFMPGVPGTIIPNHMIGGGGGTVQNFDLRGAVVTEALYAQMQAAADQAAVRGAIGGSQLASEDGARRARRRLA